MSEYSVGIDLGTTNCAVSYFPLASSQGRGREQTMLPIPQLTSVGCVEERPLLRIGSWIGGDRDGNPFVTADVLADTFQQITESLPDDWTDLELDLRIADESHGQVQPSTHAAGVVIGPEPLVNLFAGFKKVSRPKVVPIFPTRADGTQALRQP